MIHSLASPSASNAGWSLPTPHRCRGPHRRLQCTLPGSGVPAPAAPRGRLPRGRELARETPPRNGAPTRRGRGRRPPPVLCPWCPSRQHVGDNFLIAVRLGRPWSIGAAVPPSVEG